MYAQLRRFINGPDHVRKCIITMEVDCIATVEIEQLPFVDPDEEFDPGIYHLVPAQDQLDLFPEDPDH